MQRKKRDTRLELPSEHGFWVMLVVILVAGAGATGFALEAMAVAVGEGLVCMVAGGLVHRTVRKSPLGQVLSAALLAGLFIPIAGIGRVPVERIGSESLAWAATFASFAVVVRSVFARAGKGTKERLLTALALGLPMFSLVFLCLIEQMDVLPISLAGLSGAILFAIWRPTPRDLRASGLLMSVLLVLALALVLVR